MQPESSIAALETNAPIIAALVRAMPAADVRWQPTPDDWSVFDVVNHLVDEEINDFRLRLDYVLHHPGEDPPQFDPQARVREQGGATESVEIPLARFLAEREGSLAWLRGLQVADWDASWTHPSGWVHRAGELLVSWAAHDLLHLRQLVELQFASRAKDAAPYSGDYAGKW